MRVAGTIFEGDNPVGGESRARALAVNEVVRDAVSSHLDDQRSIFVKSLGGGGVAVLVGLSIALAGVHAILGPLLVVAGLLGGVGGAYYARSMEPDVSVNRVEKAYWTGYCVPEEGGIVVYDATDTLPTSEFNLERLEDRGTIETAQDRLDAIEEYPVVMPPEENAETVVTEALEDVQAEVESAQPYTVNAPVVSANGPERDAVSFFAEQADEDPVDVEVAVDPETAEEDVEAMSDLESMADADDSTTDLQALSEQSRRLVGDLSGMQETAVELLNDHVQTAADAFGLVSYHFYCPDCQLDDIDSRLELADPQADEWYCDTCRSHHDTSAVIPRHRIKDDLVNPVWDQLWIEKDDERRRVYENIEDQKAELQEREFEQRSEEIRTATDRIRDLRSRIRDLKTQAKAGQGTVEEIGDLMVKYERLNRERKEKFDAEVDESFERIDEETERILEETRNEEQERIEQAEEEAAEKAELMREDERRREVAKFMAEQQREDARTLAEMKQDEQHHKDDVLLDTRGGLSISDKLNDAFYWKTQTFGATKHGGDR